MTAALIKYEAARTALAECKAVDEVKVWADKAAAMQAYARMAKDRELESVAAEIRIRAERRLGEMLTAQKADGGLSRGAAGMEGNQHTGKLVPSSQTRTPKLADAGISYDLSSRAQKLAAVPEARFEAELAAKREREQKDGARVTARLERLGEQEIAKKGREPAPIDANECFDPVAELEAAHAEITKLTEEIKAAESDDLKAEAMKWRRSYERAQRAQSEAMDRAKQATDREAWTMRQLRRCGKAIGQEDPTKIAAAVEAAVREVRKAA